VLAWKHLGLFRTRLRRTRSHCASRAAPGGGCRVQTTGVAPGWYLAPLRGDIENCHYARFLATRHGDPFAEPPADSTGYNLIVHPQARAISELFNSSYGLMLEMLMRFFAHRAGVEVRRRCGRHTIDL
jgi:hypothetical protein